MAKINKSKLIKLIENLVDRLVENKVERLVEERTQKIVPMLVEHEVNRIIRESINDGSNVFESNQSNNSTGNAIADDVMNDSDIQNKQQLREYFKSKIGGDTTLSFNSNDTHNIAARNGNSNMNVMNSNLTTPDGEPVNINNPAVNKVLNVMNQDFSSKLADIRERSNNRNGRFS